MLLSISGLLGCTSERSAGNADAGSGTNDYVLATPPEWFADHFPIPPGFAPTIPLEGKETTREPPGMYDPMSDEFFSYAFFWYLDKNPPLDADSLRSHIGSYYQGLCGAATVTLTQTPVSAPTAAKRAPKAVFSGTLETGTCFDRPTPTAQLEVNTYDCPNHPSVLTLISSFPKTSPISLELAALRDGFDCH